MDLLRIESTKFTPGIVLDPHTNVLEFYGFSLPENAIEFYQPVINWITKYKNDVLSLSNYPQIHVIFKLSYYNSSSLRKLIEIFTLFSEMYHKGVPITISWQYVSEDPSMAESGKEIGEITKIPVTLVAYN
ncbi:MAG TPA: DUF1987 domain-containing protein [Bacteroidales bacterium]|nr:DUF1987 domain-containing protein [Bacteroidales bacterium]